MSQGMEITDCQRTLERCSIGFHGLRAGGGGGEPPCDIERACPHFAAALPLPEEAYANETKRRKSEISL